MSSTGGNSSGGVFHDDVKDMVCRWGEAHKYTFEKEAKAYKDLKNRPFIPDVVLTLTYAGKKEGIRKEKVFVECQKDVSCKWLADHELIYEGKDWICIDLDKLDGCYGGNCDDGIEGEGAVFAHRVIGDVYKDLSQQLDNETTLPIETNKSEHISQVCEQCGERFKDLRGHQYREKRRLEAKKDRL